MTYDTTSTESFGGGVEKHVKAPSLMISASMENNRSFGDSSCAEDACGISPMHKEPAVCDNHDLTRVSSSTSHQSSTIGRSSSSSSTGSERVRRSERMEKVRQRHRNLSNDSRKPLDPGASGTDAKRREEGPSLKKVSRIAVEADGVVFVSMEEFRSSLLNGSPQTVVDERMRPASIGESESSSVCDAELQLTGEYGIRQGQLAPGGPPRNSQSVPSVPGKPREPPLCDVRHSSAGLTYKQGNGNSGKIGSVLPVNGLMECSLSDDPASQAEKKLSETVDVDIGSKRSWSPSDVAGPFVSMEEEHFPDGEELEHNDWSPPSPESRNDSPPFDDVLLARKSSVASVEPVASDDSTELSHQGGCASLVPSLLKAHLRHATKPTARLPPKSMLRRRSDGAAHERAINLFLHNSDPSLLEAPHHSGTMKHQRRQTLDNSSMGKHSALAFRALNRIEEAMPDDGPKSQPGEGVESVVGGDRSSPNNSDDDGILDEAAARSTWRDHVTALADEIEVGQSYSLKGAESDVGSIDAASVEGLPHKLQSRLLIDSEGPEREKILHQLDGIQGFSQPRPQKVDEPEQLEESEIVKANDKAKVANSFDSSASKDSRDLNFAYMLLDAANSALNFMLGISAMDCRQDDDEGKDGRSRTSNTCNGVDDSFALLGCAPVIQTRKKRKVAVTPSLVRVTSNPLPPSYAQTVHNREFDPRLETWVQCQFVPRSRPPRDGSYHLGRSRTVVVHEILRRAWTWCTEWSPAGEYLAIGTENHHLAIVDTVSSTVWRVLHDRKLVGPVQNNSTHSIRAIAWGSQLIAIGGTGNAVSIVQPSGEYPIVHVIPNVGFVGALDWNRRSGLLAIGSRLGKAFLERVWSTNEKLPNGSFCFKNERLHEIKRKNWVNSVKFSPDGVFLAVGDAGGFLGVFSLTDSATKCVELQLAKSFTMNDSILSIEWSPDGKWLYAGGEDCHVAVIDTKHWEVIHRLNRERWVQCISSSSSGTHLAVGGVSSEISLLDTSQGWDSVMGVDLKGLVPLSAKWHPKDQYLAITGQSDSVIAVETTNARHVEGHHLHATSPVRAISFSPDGRLVIIGNESGIVTYYKLDGLTFETAYELVLTMDDRLSIQCQWSLNGEFSVVAGKDSLVVICRQKSEDWSIPARGTYVKPPGSAGFSVAKVVRNLGEIHSVSIDPLSQYIAVSSVDETRFFDVGSDYRLAQQFRHCAKGPSEASAIYANAWAPDGRWFATIGQRKVLTVYDTGHERLERWRAVFSLRCEFVGRALAWCPSIVEGLLYMAYGGEGNEIVVMEIRTHDGTWETVLHIPRDDTIHDLDWNFDGLLAAAIGNGTVSVIDLSYLHCGTAVSEMSDSWKYQALTCVTEIRRNRGSNNMQSVRWIPSAPGSDNLLAIGGTDGEVEIIDLTERKRCRGYAHQETVEDMIHCL
jgi:WD40 repeat protein